MDITIKDIRHIEFGDVNESSAGDSWWRELVIYAAGKTVTLTLWAEAGDYDLKVKL
jgi:hypothetical protein